MHTVYSGQEVTDLVCADAGLGVVEFEVDLGCRGMKGQLSPQTWVFHFIL